jgi:hypothetical protein
MINGKILNLSFSALILVISISFFNFFQTEFPLDWDAPNYALDAVFKRNSTLGLGRVYFSFVNSLQAFTFVESGRDFLLNLLSLLVQTSTIICSLIILISYYILTFIKTDKVTSILSLIFLLTSASIVDAAINIVPDSYMYLLVILSVLFLIKFEENGKIFNFYTATILLCLSIGFKEQSLAIFPIITISFVRHIKKFHIKHIAIITFVKLFLVVLPIYLYFTGKNFNYENFNFFVTGNIQKINPLYIFSAITFLGAILLILEKKLKINLIEAMRKISFNKMIFLTISLSIALFILILPFMRSFDRINSRYYFLLPFIILSICLYLCTRFKGHLTKVIFVPLIIMNIYILNNAQKLNFKKFNSLKILHEFVTNNPRRTLYFLNDKTSIINYLSKTVPHKAEFVFSWPGKAHNTDTLRDTIHKALKNNYRVIYYDSSIVLAEEKDDFQKALRYLKVKNLQNNLKEVIYSDLKFDFINR